MFLSEHVVGYDELWLVGDNFVSKTYREHVKRNLYDFFITENFEILPFCNSKNNCNNKNLLSRFVNNFIDALNSKGKLPQYIVIILDCDLVDYFDYEGYGVASAYSEMIKYLVTKIDTTCSEMMKKLPKKARREEYPCIYWAAAPHHKNFDNNSLRTKFNNCLESVVKLFNNMRVIKMKEIWDFENASLVCKGRFTSEGFDTYWKSIDSAVRFNVMKHEQFLRRKHEKKERGMQETSPPSRHDRRDHRDRMSDFFKRNRQDRFHWHNNQQGRKLPTPKR